MRECCGNIFDLVHGFGERWIFSGVSQSYCPVVCSRSIRSELTGIQFEDYIVNFIGSKLCFIFSLCSFLVWMYDCVSWGMHRAPASRIQTHESPSSFGRYWSSANWGRNKQKKLFQRISVGKIVCDTFPLFESSVLSRILGCAHEWAIYNVEPRHSRR